MALNDIQKRITEILKILSDEKRKKEMANGMPMDLFLGRLEKENRPLLGELRTLEKQEQFLSNHRQANISLWVGSGSVVVGILALIGSIAIAFLVPRHQRLSQEHSQIEAIYKNLVLNQDISVSNSNALHSLPGSNKISDLPELYIEDEISDDARKTLQNTFGLIQYRFFLYYLQQTALLNKEIRRMQEDFIATRTRSFLELDSTAAYLASMEYLNLEGENTKFNYGVDTECLQWFFEHNFAYLTVDGRGGVMGCSSESLEARLFNHFGYLPADTPVWFRPLLRRALNNREAGLGDSLIEL